MSSCDRIPSLSYRDATAIWATIPNAGFGATLVFQTVLPRGCLSRCPTSPLTPFLPAAVFRSLPAGRPLCQARLPSAFDFLP